MGELFSRLEDLIFWAITAVLGALATGSGWLIRRVFTNHQEIELLKADLEHRTKQRDEDRERMARIEEGIEAIQGVLMGVKNGN